MSWAIGAGRGTDCLRRRSEGEELKRARIDQHRRQDPGNWPRTAILRRVESNTGKKIDPDTATAEDLSGGLGVGNNYQHYMLYDDEVFEEILMEEKPLALVTYLLGESCHLSRRRLSLLLGDWCMPPNGLGRLHSRSSIHNTGSGFSLVRAILSTCNYATDAIQLASRHYMVRMVFWTSWARGHWYPTSA